MAIKLTPPSLFPNSKNTKKVGYVNPNFLKPVSPVVKDEVSINTPKVVIPTNNNNYPTSSNPIGDPPVVNGVVNVETISLEPGKLFDTTITNKTGYAEEFLNALDPKISEHYPSIEFLGGSLSGFNKQQGEGTIKRIDTANGVAGGPITSTGTISLTGQALLFHLLSAFGLVVRDTNGNITARILQGTNGQIDIANPSGENGNPIFSISQNPTLPGTSHVLLPSGTTAERPPIPTEGALRYNRDISAYEFYSSGTWQVFGGNVVHEFEFIENSWTGPVDNLYSYTVSANLHSKGNKALVQIYELRLGQFEQTRPDRTIVTSSGDITIQSSERFIGKMLVS